MSSQHQQQWLVRFHNVTHVVNVSQVDNNENHDSLAVRLLSLLAIRTGWPVDQLQFQQQVSPLQYPFCSVRSVSRIVGGKGGFGTLLKGQSKQAGAKRTTDFGACRDLQGRRLRHVNDEIKLRKWRELQSSDTADPTMMWKTPSGLYNWHLMVPNWASDTLSKKGVGKMQRKLHRELLQWQSVEHQKMEEKQQAQQRYHQSVSDYVRVTMEASDQTQVQMQDAIQAGLQTHMLNKKRKRATPTAPVSIGVPVDDRDEEESTISQEHSLVTLSGDWVIEESSTDLHSWQIQSKSEFATMALVLDMSSEHNSIYLEVTLVTAGLAQIGWADLTDFYPHTETGDGVGDCGTSFAYDGSRCLKFTKGSEEAYGLSWQPRDVLGCRYHSPTGEISYSLNGKEMGTAFQTEPHRPLVPTMSCNEGEILELHIRKEQMKYMPPNCVAVQDLLTQKVPLQKDPATTVDSAIVDSATPPQQDSETIHIKPVSPEQQVVVVEEAKPKNVIAPAPVTIEPLDLELYQSETDLVELGMDRLKGALLALGVKCGGSLQERASRLFSLKGLKKEEYPLKVRGKNMLCSQMLQIPE